MSSTLYWRLPDKGKSLPDELKRVLGKSYNTMDGETEFNKEYDLSYIRGLVDAGIDGALEIHDALVKHDTIILWVEH